MTERSNQFIDNSNPNMLIPLSQNSTNYQTNQKPSTNLNIKSDALRQQSRQNHIQNFKKTIRFKWNVEQTLQYLKQIQYKPVDSEQIIVEAIQSENIEYLVELIVSADPLFKAAVVGQSTRLLQLIQSRFEKPSSILLLGNLCALYLQFIKASMKKMLLTKLIQQMTKMKSNLKVCQIYSWALTQMARQPHLLSANQVRKCCSQLYFVFVEAFSAKQSVSHLCTHLCRLVSQFSMVVCFEEEFLEYFTTIQPTREVDRINTFISIENQIKNCKYSQNTMLRIKLAQYLMYIFPLVPQTFFKQKKSSFYNLLTILINRSQPDLAIHLCTKKFDKILSQYQYGNIQYLTMLRQLFLKLDRINQNQLLDKLRYSGLIENLVNDISDFNVQIGYSCLVIMEILVKQILGQGQMEYVEWILSLGLEKQIEQFMENFGKNQQMNKHAVNLIEMIARQ